MDIQKDIKLSHHAIDEASDGILLVSKSAIILRANKKSCILWNKLHYQLIGAQLIQITPYFNTTKWTTFWDKLLVEKETSFETQLKQNESFEMDVEISSKHIVYNDIEYAILFIRDISERKKDEQNLISAYNEIELLKNKLEEENTYLQQEIKHDHNFENIIAQSEKFKDVLRLVEQVAETNGATLIMGETGTGKELIARAIHNISKRNKRPLVKINCSAIPEALIESELFGYEKGAFTGANSRKIGVFELAHRGTLFLDEIGELPVNLQPKLLRALQDGEISRLGNPNTIKVDVRIIAATNRDLSKAIIEKEFRQDLYYRLNVFPITIPPLRDRMDDLLPMIKYFMTKFATYSPFSFFKSH